MLFREKIVKEGNYFHFEAFRKLKCAMLFIGIFCLCRTLKFECFDWNSNGR